MVVAVIRLRPGVLIDCAARNDMTNIKKQTEEFLRAPLERYAELARSTEPIARVLRATRRAKANQKRAQEEDGMESAGPPNKKPKTARTIEKAPRAKAHTTEDAEEDAGGRNRKPNTAKTTSDGSSSKTLLHETVIAPEKPRFPAASRDNFTTPPRRRHIGPPSAPQPSRVASHGKLLEVSTTHFSLRLSCDEFSLKLHHDSILSHCNFEGMSSPDCVRQILDSPIMDARGSSRLSSCAFLDLNGNKAFIEWGSD